MSDFNAAQVLAEAYTLYKKHHDGLGLDFKIAIAQVRKEAKAEALREAADIKLGNGYYEMLVEDELNTRADLLGGDE